MINNNQHKNNKRRFGKVPGSGGFSLWRYLLIALGIWFVIMLFDSQYRINRVNIPYSEFKEQVQEGNVESIRMVGKEIDGEFSKVYKYVGNDKDDTTSYSYFSTVLLSVEDKELVPLLEKNNVTVQSEIESDGWIYYVLIFILPWVFLIGLFYYMRRKMQGKMNNLTGGGGGLFGIGKSKARKFEGWKSDVTYDNVAGLENTKRDLAEIIDYLKDPEKFRKMGADIPKGILLMGPPGTGKTLLAKATAGEAGVSFFSISGSEFIEMFVGVGASRVRDLFKTAKNESPAIVFIDEIDSVGRTRGAGLGGGHDEREQTLNQILSEMDGFEPNESVIVLAATNRPDVLDPALIRPGRFDRQITLSLPQKEARIKILEIHSENVPLADDVDFESVAARCVGFSGADLKNLVNEAALLAGRLNNDVVTMQEIEDAKDKITLGDKREEKINDEEKKIVAYHESGHALLAKLLPEADPLQKVTIIPRGRALGVTEQRPETERYNLRKKYLIDRLTVLLGGRASEAIIFDDISNGAAMDLKQASKLARKMVCQWGMSERLGPVYFKLGEEHPFLGREINDSKDYSEYTAKIIDEEVQRLIKENLQRAEKLLTDNRVKLDSLAEALLENETMENEEINWLLEKVEKGEQE